MQNQTKRVKEREKAKLHDITRQKALLKEINDQCERKTSPLVSATSIPGATQSRLSRIEMDGEVGGQPGTQVRRLVSFLSTLLQGQ